jgi:hypothetical protein
MVTLYAFECPLDKGKSKRKCSSERGISSIKVLTGDTERGRCWFLGGEWSPNGWTGRSGGQTQSRPISGRPDKAADPPGP